MLLSKANIQHVNSVTHEGKVVVVATGTDGGIWYTVKQDGFENNYLTQQPEQRTGWEDWELLVLPDDDDDQSVLAKELEELTYEDASVQYLLRSQYKTRRESAVAPVQLVSGLGHLYIFRQSKSGSLLVDRFVLDGLTNRLGRKIEVRFKRSKQKYTASQNHKKNSAGLTNLDALDYVDINGNKFYEPTTELSLIQNLANGWFSVVLLPTNEQDKYRWHIFAYNSERQTVELTTLRASAQGLFDVRDYTISDPEPRKIPGIIKRTLDFGSDITVAKGLSATKYDVQKERETEEEDSAGNKIKYLLREATRVMLVVGTSRGDVAALSFAAAADGTLSQIADEPSSSNIRRSNTRQILLPLNTLDEIKAIGTANPPVQGRIVGLARGAQDEVVLASQSSTGLAAANVTTVKISGTQDYNQLYAQVTKVDEHTLELTPSNLNSEAAAGGNWEIVPAAETGLIYDGMVTAYEITHDGKLRVSALNHGLDSGDAVQIVDTKDYNGTYSVTKVDDKTFSLDGLRWQAGSTISAKLQTQKRRGITLDGVDDYVALPEIDDDFSGGFTVEAWVWYDGFEKDSRIIDLGNGPGQQNILLANHAQSDRLTLFLRLPDDQSVTLLSPCLELEKWLHIAATIDRSGNAKLYKNGEVVETGGTNFAIENINRVENFIGKSNWIQDGFFHGKMSDVRIWNKARSGEDIKHNMYLQLTGQEVGLVGNWRLDAIVEGKERRVIDFSVKGRDGIVHGGAYVSSVTLHRYLGGAANAGNAVLKYENEELFAVSERATYKEEFEFRTDGAVDPTAVDRDGNTIFLLTYKGKKNRNSQLWVDIVSGATQFESAVEAGWYKASSRFTVPDGVSMIRAFGIGDLNGDWTRLDIRKHKMELVSDSITEDNYTDRVANLKSLVDNQIQLQEDLKQLVNDEILEVELLKEKRALEARIERLTINQSSLENKSRQDMAAARKEKSDRIRSEELMIQGLKAELSALQTDLKTLQDKQQKERSNPLNYWCRIRSRSAIDQSCYIDSYIDNSEKGKFVSNKKFSDLEAPETSFRFVATGEDGDYYNIVCMKNNHIVYAVDGDAFSAKITAPFTYSGHYSWKFVQSGKYYSIHRRGLETVLDRYWNGAIYLNRQHHGNEQKWELIIINDSPLEGTALSSINRAISFKRNEIQTKEMARSAARKRLEDYGESASSEPDGARKQIDAVKKQIDQVTEQLAVVTTQLKRVQESVGNINELLIEAVKKSQSPQEMLGINTDSRALLTQVGWLEFVRPTSRISTIETCEGNVQLNYFDDQGRMRQTNYDATSDSNNTTIGQWIPDASLRTCLNFHQTNDIVRLNPTIHLGQKWTIEAWFFYPLPEVANVNIFSRGTVADCTIYIQKGEYKEELGFYRAKPTRHFVGSGYDLRQLSIGWHHIAAVAQGKYEKVAVTFYIDGEKIGFAQDKAQIADPLDIKYIGNSHGGRCQFGKMAEVRIWDIALSDAEVAVNSKTCLTGNEPGLLAYFPCNEASGQTVRDKTGRHQGKVQDASWVACTAPIGKLETHQVMQFDGVDDYVALPEINEDFSDGFTVEAWAWYDSFEHYSRIIDLGNGPGQQNILLANHAQSDRLTLVLRLPDNQSVKLLSPCLELGKWMHIAATIDRSGNAKLYKNGEVVATDGTNFSIENVNRVENFIGKSNWIQDGFFHGKMSDVRIWNKARSAVEIQSNMYIRLTGKEAGIVAYYPLDKIQDNVIEDLGPNQYHGMGHGVAVGSEPTLPISHNALVSSEYSTVGKDGSVMMRRFLAIPKSNGVELLAGKRIEQLELRWIGNGQFAPTLLGYIEGAPPIPSENLTRADNYAGATSVELALSEDIDFNWTRSQESGLGAAFDLFAGVDAEADSFAAFLVAGGTYSAGNVRVGLKADLDFNYQFQNESSITSSSSLSMTDSLQLYGTQERGVRFPHLGKRFIPKNVGYALVISALSDVFITRLKRTGTMIGYQVRPVENIPPDVNTITFLINPAYTMNGSLDGMTGSSATSQRFHKHVPAMRAQLGSLYPASYYRLQEAYALKKLIEEQDKERESYFMQFDSRLVDETSLARQTDVGEAPEGVTLGRAENKPTESRTESEQDAAAQKQEQATEKLKQEAKAGSKEQTEKAKKKQAEINQRIQDQEARAHATASFAAWQKRMENIQIRAGKRNIVNNYVWDADGGLRTETQSFANTAEHSIGGSFQMNASVGAEGAYFLIGFGAELTALATVNLTQTMNKTETRSKGIELNVDLSGVEGGGITDHNDLPIVPGEKVNRYRFMSFYLEGSTDNYNDFFNYVVDPEWLASNSEEARALRQAKGKANKAWRVLHRVTYVERPALMGFGRDRRQLPANKSALSLEDLKAQVASLEQQNAVMERKLDAILNKLNSQ
ncbi:LamG domain-containing protein [filamentous cyanobacterium LEGE 11480]|uniref:LamG domain-containing protein n=1 Tax=Romeriopsis navalis LEGE 11480 TaxID=2777977 RepID=A0A928Z2G0_9CYAN|nr:LamG-like jellyroll fold domain-containing protein [Romeriopsis navalis]MBE9028355.1 LamG domain-containing protein [Romeriopsis navalis LEGE 11480]